MTMPPVRDSVASAEEALFKRAGHVRERANWMRRRLLAREGDDTQARRRLVRSEVAGVVAIVALEASLLMQG